MGRVVHGSTRWQECCLVASMKIKMHIPFGSNSSQRGYPSTRLRIYRRANAQGHPCQHCKNNVSIITQTSALMPQGIHSNFVKAKYQQPSKPSDLPPWLLGQDHSRQCCRNKVISNHPNLCDHSTPLHMHHGPSLQLVLCPFSKMRNQAHSVLKWKLSKIYSKYILKQTAFRVKYT